MATRRRVRARSRDGPAPLVHAERLAEGDATLLDAAEDESGAFVGEELRRVIARAMEEGEIGRVSSLPWGLGACFNQSAQRRDHGRPGVFLACHARCRMRTPATGYWRHVELFDAHELVTSDLDMLRRIDPEGMIPARAGRPRPGASLCIASRGVSRPSSALSSPRLWAKAQSSITARLQHQPASSRATATATSVERQAARLQVHPTPMKAQPGRLGAGAHLGPVVLAPSLERGASPMRAPVMPGGLHQQATHMAPLS